MKIGYFIPEFPGQTHAFFWREYQALRDRGIEPILISTRKPPRNIVSHKWAAEAMEQTRYLFPPEPSLLFQGLRASRQTATEGVAAGLSTVTSLGRALAFLARSEVARPRDRLRLAALAGPAIELAGIAAQEGFKHVHTHSCADSANVCVLANLLYGLTYSLTLHGPLRDYGPNQREKWRHAAFGIVITERLLAEVERDLGGALPPRVEIAPMGVQIDKFQRRAAYAPWTGEGPLRIFACGRLNPCKGHDDVARAIAILRKQGIDARLVVAGEDELGGTGYHRVLQGELDAMGVAPAATLLGAVSEPQIIDQLERAHVFALGSLEEPLGVAIMEAMAMSMPVVVTGAGGVPELVENGVDGVIVSPRDPEGMARGLMELANDPARAVTMGQAARRKVERSFNSLRSAELLDRLLRPS